MKKCLLYVFPLSLIFAGCVSIHEVPIQDARPDDLIREIVYKNGETVKFDEKGGRIFFTQDRLSGLKDYKSISATEIPISDIKEIRLSHSPIIPVESISENHNFYELLLVNKEIIPNDSSIIIKADEKKIFVPQPDGKPIRTIPFFVVEEVRTEKPELYPLENILPYLKLYPYEILKKNNIIASFVDTIVCIPEETIIKGFPLGERISKEYLVNDVYTLKVEKSDPTKTWFLICGGGIVVVGIIAYLILEDAEQHIFGEKTCWTSSSEY